MGGVQGGFIGKVLPRERREVKVEEFINIKLGNMSVDENSLKFTIFSKYGPSLVSNLRDEMNRFVMGVSDLVKEECRTTMLHYDMDLARLTMYTQSIEESKLKRMCRNLKRNGRSEQDQPRFKKRYQTQDGPSDPKVKLYEGSGSQRWINL